MKKHRMEILKYKYDKIVIMSKRRLLSYIPALYIASQLVSIESGPCLQLNLVETCSSHTNLYSATPLFATSV